MSLMRQPKTADRDFDRIYREGRPPWDTGRVSGELVRLVDEGAIRPCSTLELGCGTGADAVWLARHGFEVTAIDISPIAVERARLRGEQEDALVRFVTDDALEFARSAGSFDLVYDKGFYHHVRRTDLDRFLDILWRITRPGSFYLTLAGNADDRTEGGPPRVSEHNIHSELGRLLDVVQLRTFRFESPDRRKGYLAWSCLMKRPDGLV